MPDSHHAAKVLAHKELLPGGNGSKWWWGISLYMKLFAQSFTFFGRQCTCWPSSPDGTKVLCLNANLSIKEAVDPGGLVTRWCRGRKKVKAQFKWLLHSPFSFLGLARGSKQGLSRCCLVTPKYLSSNYPQIHVLSLLRRCSVKRNKTITTVKATPPTTTTTNHYHLPSFQTLPPADGDTR